MHADHVFNGHNRKIWFCGRYLVFSYMAHSAYSFHKLFTTSLYLTKLATKLETYWNNQESAFQNEIIRNLSKGRSMKFCSWIWRWSDVSILIPTFHGVIFQWSWCPKTKKAPKVFFRCGLWLVSLLIFVGPFRGPQI